MKEFDVLKNEEDVLMEKEFRQDRESEGIWASKSTESLNREDHKAPPISTDSTLENKSKKSKFKGKWQKAIALVLVGSVSGGLSIGAGSELVKAQLGGTGIYGPAYVESGDLSALSESGQQQVATFNRNDKDIVAIVDSVGPSVVAITSKVAYQDYFNNVSYQEGAGSGVIFKIDAQNVYILTNNHVIDNAEQLIVELKKDSFANAQIVGRDKSTDVAILKVAIKDIEAATAKNLKTAVFGNSDNIKVGETAIAIGNPLGYNNSVTVGVISALDRELKSQNSLKLIQTDAAINPGNSGGALVSGQGEVIGINSIKISNEEVEGIGFSIPINSIKPLIEEILTKGYISRPYLGIYGADVSKEAAELYEVPTGVLVRSVLEGTGAAKGGLKAGDIIISINDTRINSMTDISTVIAKLKVGETVKVKVVRDQSKQMTLSIKLQDSNK